MPSVLDPLHVLKVTGEKNKIKVAGEETISAEMKLDVLCLAALVRPDRCHFGFPNENHLFPTL